MNRDQANDEIRIEALHLDDGIKAEELRLRGCDFIRQLTNVATGRENVLLLELCAYLARSYYELRPPQGAIILLDAESIGRTSCLSLTSPVSIEDHPGSRKLLEVSTPDMPLICDGPHFVGFLSEPARAAYAIQFRRGRVWAVLDGPRTLCLFQDDLPVTAGRILQRQAFYDCIASRFAAVTPGGLFMLWEILRAASVQPYGTNILITGSAEVEAERLVSQGIRISPAALTPELTARLTSIDGTLLVDIEGRAHAIGVILDGVVGNGNWRRGGRYNSAIMYCENSRSDSTIIVISESGTIDLVPHPGSGEQSYLGLADVSP